MGQSLKCCSRMPGDKDGREAMLNVQPNIVIPQKIKNETSRFSQIYCTKLENDRLQFILSLKNYDEFSQEEVIKVELQQKKDLFSLFVDRNYEWIIEQDVVKDFNNQNSLITRAQDKRTNEKFTLQVINFEEYEDYEFKAALYQIYIMQKLQIVNNGLPHSHIIQIKDQYLIYNQEKLNNQKTLIIVFEYFDASLHEIIQYRKSQKQNFTTDELIAFLRDINSALSTMFKLGISHRDIRPTNIWYVAQEKCYKIGCFQDAKIVDKIKEINIKGTYKFEDGDGYNTVRGVPQYLSPEILNLMHINQNQKVLQYNPYSLDMYGLGLTLVLMKNLYDEIDFGAILNNFKQRGSAFIDIDLGCSELNAIVDQMVNRIPYKRINSIDLDKYCQNYFTLKDYPKVNENNLIKNLKQKKKKQNQDEYLQDQELIANEYFKMFQFDKWIYKYDEIISNYETHQQDINKADVLVKIGNGYLELNDVYKSKDYFMRASVIYNETGHEYRKRSLLDGSIKYYEMAIECVRRANNGEDTIELALLLENIGNIYKMKGEFQKARAFQEEALQIVLIQIGEKSVEAARLYNNLGNLYASIGLYKKSDKRLKKALKIVENLYVPQEEQASLKAMCLCSLGEVNRLKGNYENALEFLLEALEIREEFLGSGHIDLASNCENLGNVYFDLGDFHRSKKYYERALVIKKSSLPNDSPDIALTLNNLGNVFKSQKEVEKAKKCYEDCLHILYLKFGKDCTNPSVATCLGNLGLVQKQMGNYQQAQSNLEKCIQILTKSVGEEHPDCLFFQKHLYRINQRIENSHYESSIQGSRNH